MSRPGRPGDRAHNAAAAAVDWRSGVREAARRRRIERGQGPVSARARSGVGSQVVRDGPWSGTTRTGQAARAAPSTTGPCTAFGDGSSAGTATTGQWASATTVASPASVAGKTSAAAPMDSRRSAAGRDSPDGPLSTGSAGTAVRIAASAPARGLPPAPGLLRFGDHRDGESAAPGLRTCPAQRAETGGRLVGAGDDGARHDGVATGRGPAAVRERIRGPSSLPSGGAARCRAADMSPPGVGSRPAWAERGRHRQGRRSRPVPPDVTCGSGPGLPSGLGRPRGPVSSA